LSVAAQSTTNCPVFWLELGCCPCNGTAKADLDPPRVAITSTIIIEHNRQTNLRTIILPSFLGQLPLHEAQCALQHTDQHQWLAAVPHYRHQEMIATETPQPNPGDTHQGIVGGTVMHECRGIVWDFRHACQQDACDRFGTVRSRMRNIAPHSPKLAERPVLQATIVDELASKNDAGNATVAHTKSPKASNAEFA
jgi:hypothetical protein